MLLSLHLSSAFKCILQFGYGVPDTSTLAADNSTSYMKKKNKNKKLFRTSSSGLLYLYYYL